MKIRLITFFPNQKMRVLTFLFFLAIVNYSFSQHIDAYEKTPAFPECDSLEVSQQKVCFENTLNKMVYKTFKVPDIVEKENYKGDIKILLEIDKEGAFKVLYVDAIYEELKEETKRVFDQFPKITAGTYNGKPTFFQYSLTLKIPLVDPQLAMMIIRMLSKI